MISKQTATRGRGARSRDESGMSTVRIALTVLAGVLALACVATVTVKWVAPGMLPASWTAADRADDRNTEVLTATRRAMAAFLDVDYATIDDQIEDVLAVSTGQFKKQFGDARVQYAALTRQGKAVSEGQIREIGITRANDHEALLSVAADSTVSNTATAEAEKKGEKVDKVRVYYFQVTMNRVGDEWLMSNLEVIG
jgi:Mce-associated membrane protein